MAINRFYNKTASIERMVVTQAVEATEETEAIPYKQERAVVTTIQGHLQQASAELAERLGIAMTQGFVFWCSINSDVKIGDVAVINEKNYTVIGVQVNDYGFNAHCEVILQYNG